jgi:hypothetical protein
MTDQTIADATAGSIPLPASPVPADGLPQLSSAGATDPMRAVDQCSYRIDAISAALAKAQGQMANPAKGAVNPHFKSQYADLSAGLNAIRAALSANGIAIVQQTRMDDDMLMLHTMLSHASGQWIGSLWPVVKLPAPPQVIGSALTYARRYTLFALAGIAGENDDDDGNAASSKYKDENDGPLIDADQLAQIRELLAETESNVGVFFLTIGCIGFSDMTVPQYRKGLALLNEKKRRMATATP